jgi:predicted metal-dependent phosphoesterase TrpH
MMKLDLHVHTKYSADGTVEPKDYIKQARKIGLSGFAVTDHNEIKGAKKTFELAKEYKNIVILHGIEISSADGHILAYGVKDQIPRGLPPEEVIEKIVDQGGVAVAAHPFRRASGLGQDVVKSNKFEHIEVLNHRSMHAENQKALNLAREMDTGITGGSDAHFENELGLAATEFKIQNQNEDDIIAEIAKNKTVPVGEDSTLFQGISMYIKLVIHWLKRGLRRV